MGDFDTLLTTEYRNSAAYSDRARAFHSIQFFRHPVFHAGIQETGCLTGIQIKTIMDCHTPVIKSAERYVPQFKQKVLDFLQSHDDPTSETAGSRKRTKITISAAAKKFRVHPTTISDWIQDAKRKQEIESLQENHDDLPSSCTKTVSSNVSENFVEPQKEDEVSKIENELAKWLQSERVKGSCAFSLLTACAISTKILEILENHKPDLKVNLSAKLQWLLLWAQKLGDTEKVVEKCGQVIGWDFEHLKPNSRILVS